MIPSVSVLQHYQANFTAFCSNKIKCSFFQTDSGEGFEFDEKAIISLIWKGANKDLLAGERPTPVVITTDGVKVTKNLNLVMTDLKEMETKRMSLIASHLLSRGNNDDGNGFGQLDQQSAFHCFPLKCIFGHESSQFLSQNFMNIYQRIMATAEPGNDGQNTMFPEYKPSIVSCPVDMKLAWLATGKGGVAKQKEHFYYCCLMKSKDINKANNVSCSICTSREPEEISNLTELNIAHECLHQEVITPDLMQRLRLHMLSCI
jgi:hypothetical protein